MENMIERVARAIHETERAIPRIPGAAIAISPHMFPWDGNEMEEANPGEGWRDWVDKVRSKRRIAARAAIEAMRTPTEPMLAAGRAVTMDPYGGREDSLGVAVYALREAYPAMIDEILNPTPADQPATS